MLFGLMEWKKSVYSHSLWICWYISNGERQKWEFWIKVWRYCLQNWIKQQKVWKREWKWLFEPMFRRRPLENYCVMLSKFKTLNSISYTLISTPNRKIKIKTCARISVFVHNMRQLRQKNKSFLSGTISLSIGKYVI